MNTISHDDLVYLAGFFDGEGHVSVACNYSSDQYFAQVIVAQKRKEVLDYYASALGIGHMVLNKGSNVWKWCMVGQQAEDFLRMIFPYVREKKLAVSLVLQYRNLVHTEDHRSFLYKTLCEYYYRSTSVAGINRTHGAYDLLEAQP